MAINTTVQTGSQTARDEVRTLGNIEALLLANETAGTCGAATATVTSQVKTATSMTYRIDGAWKTALAATDPFWTLSGVTVPVASYQKYYLLVDGSAAASVVQGVPASTAAGVVMPFPPQSKAIAAVLTIQTDATHTFVPGTTLLGATGITATFTQGFDPSTLALVVLG
jgi:hypothetical protein